MAKFLVEKEKDAFVYYAAVVEADSKEEAELIGQMNTGNDGKPLKWVYQGYQVFDDEDIVEVTEQPDNYVLVEVPE